MAKKSSPITVSKPLKDLEDIEECFEELFGHSFLPVWRRKPFVEDGEWMSVMDMLEKDDKLAAKAEISGRKPDDNHVS